MSPRLASAAALGAVLVACATPPSTLPVPAPGVPPVAEPRREVTPTPPPSPPASERNDTPAAVPTPTPTAPVAEPSPSAPSATPAPVRGSERAPPAQSTTLPPPARLDWLRPASWDALPGWAGEDFQDVWPALLASCQAVGRQSVWQEPCQAAGRLADPDAATVRGFLQSRFNVFQIVQPDGAAEGLVTGYYEPLLHGSRERSERYRHPLRAPPEDLLVVDLGALYPELKQQRVRGRVAGRQVVPYFTRAEIDAGTPPQKGREIAWVDDPVELFFLHVQGSGRLLLESGDLMRVGYAEHNGHPYRSIGRWLIENGELPADKASMQGIKDWARRNPGRLDELLAVNPSYVFFRELTQHDGGPIGALGVPLTAQRSIAVDPRAIPLGAPVWLATSRPNSAEPLNRLTFAQDTGTAIRGNVRADYFWGFGDGAGREAGAMKQKGRMWLLLPRGYPLAGPVTANGL